MSNFNILCRKKFTSLGTAELKQASIKDLTSENLFFKGSNVNYAEKIKTIIGNVEANVDIQKINVSINLSLSENIEIMIDSNGIYFDYNNTDNLFLLNDKLILQNVSDNKEIPCYIFNITNNKIYIGYYTNLSGNYNITSIIRYELLKQNVNTYEISIENTPNDLSIIPIFLPMIPVDITINTHFLINVDKNININTIMLIPAFGQYINGSDNFYKIKHIKNEDNTIIYMLSSFFNGNNIWFTN
jgi:hypothetical protein